MGPVCMSLSPGDSGGWFGSAPCVLPSLGRSRCPQGGISAPPASLPSPQCGEGTPQVTGFFEVFVAGKLVHSKKVCLSILPHWGPRGGWDWGWCLGPSPPLPWSSLLQGGDGYVDTESKFLKLVAAIKAALAQA